VEHDIKEELRFAHPKEELEEDEMTGAADGQKLGQSLNDSKKDGLKDAHHESIQKTVIRTLGGHGDTEKNHRVSASLISFTLVS
jgi:hypothetical protein